MALGVRSYGNTLLVQNIFEPDNLPDTIPLLKNFARKILTPNLKCVEADCGTTIGRVLQVPESDLVGLIRLDTNAVITDQDVTDWIRDGVYYTRVRDTSSCLSQRGFCRNCGRGYAARIGSDEAPSLGESYQFKSSPRALQNYISKTFSGSVMGWSPVASEPLQTTPDTWTSLTTHLEMDSLCRLLRPLGMARDDYEYLFSVDNILERALLIIGTYGVYGNV